MPKKDSFVPVPPIFFEKTLLTIGGALTSKFIDNNPLYMRHFYYIILILTGIVSACQQKSKSVETDTTKVDTTAPVTKLPTKDSLWFCNNVAQVFEKRWIKTSLGHQRVGISYTEKTLKNPTLILFLHGDSPFSNPVYQYIIVKAITKNTKNTIAVGILRPGYQDNCGDQSEGNKGEIMGDNYSAEVIASLAEIVQQLKTELTPQKTIVMGHSGGAALSALLAARYPAMQDKTILLACPCDLHLWRQNMRKLTKNKQWDLPMPGLSPIDEITKLDNNKEILVFAGSEDKVAPPALSNAYVKATKKAGKKISYHVLPGVDHNGITRPKAFKKILKSLQD